MLQTSENPMRRELPETRTSERRFRQAQSGRLGIADAHSCDRISAPSDTVESSADARCIEVGMIEDVKHIPPHVERDALAELGVFRECGPKRALIARDSQHGYIFEEE
jgi:hypothetical protein